MGGGHWTFVGGPREDSNFEPKFDRSHFESTDFLRKLSSTPTSHLFASSTMAQSRNKPSHDLLWALQHSTIPLTPHMSLMYWKTWPVMSVQKDSLAQDDTSVSLVQKQVFRYRLEQLHAGIYINTTTSWWVPITIKIPSVKECRNKSRQELSSDLFVEFNAVTDASSFSDNRVIVPPTRQASNVGVMLQTAKHDAMKQVHNGVSLKGCSWRSQLRYPIRHKMQACADAKYVTVGGCCWRWLPYYQSLSYGELFDNMFDSVSK